MGLLAKTRSKEVRRTAFLCCLQRPACLFCVTHICIATICTLSCLCCAATDLAREVSKEIPDVKVDFMKASSYGAASESNGAVTVKEVGDLSKWEQYNILLVSPLCHTPCSAQVPCRTAQHELTCKADRARASLCRPHQVHHPQQLCVGPRSKPWHVCQRCHLQ